MKRLIACASLVAVATTAALPATPSKVPAKPAHAKAVQKKIVAKARCKVAPADEYFGKLKMSILGIRNTIKDQGLKADFYPERADSTLGAIALTEDALHDWQHKYPCDSWLPGTIFALEHFYTKIHTADGLKHVHATYAWLRHDFPKNRLVVVALRESETASSVPPQPPVAAGAAVSPSPAPSLSPSPSPTSG